MIPVMVIVMKRRKKKRKRKKMGSGEVRASRYWDNRKTSNITDLQNGNKHIFYHITYRAGYRRTMEHELYSKVLYPFRNGCVSLVTVDATLTFSQNNFTYKLAVTHLLS